MSDHEPRKVSMPHPVSISTRLDEFRLLEPGWLAGYGPPGVSCGLVIDTAGLDWLDAAFSKHYPKGLPLPFTYPTEDGGIYFEWGFKGGVDVSFKIDLTTKVGQGFLHIPRPDESKEITLDLSDPEEWLRFPALLLGSDDYWREVNGPKEGNT